MIAAHSVFSDENDDEEFATDCLLKFSWFWTSVRILAWYPIFSSTVEKIFYGCIKTCVFGLCSSKYDCPMLDVLCQWKHLVLYPWLDTIQATRVSDQCAAEPLSCLASMVVNENYVGARIHEFYDIIAEFPESTHAVDELRDALLHTQQHHLVARSLRVMLQRRLLHLGANTAQIIDIYISAVRVLRILDPRDVFLDTVTFPVRSYLQHRKDTVRCIIANLTDELSGELYEELHQSNTRPHRADDPEAPHNNETGDCWVPKSKVCHSTRTGSMGDILSMLISIYGTKEVFVDEYRSMLAQKLLTKSFLQETTQEHKSLELLKLRFGEATLHHCEIMLRDVEDSKRLNKRKSCEFVEATVISQVFWPKLAHCTLAVHPRVDLALGLFTQMYSTLKTPRKLVWQTEMGTAQLELNLGSQQRAFTVSLVHANIILHFDGCDTRSLANLAIATNISLVCIQNAIAFWINQGVLQENSPGLYFVMSKFHQCSAATMLDEDIKHVDSGQLLQRDYTTLFCPYIVGALSSLGKLTLKRLHSLLGIFMQEENVKYDVSPRELSRVLEQLCEAHTIEYTHGVYALPSAQGHNL